MYCHYFADGVCRSCQWLTKPYQQQIHDKQMELEALLAPFSITEFQPVIKSEPAGFRNKAKMVVSGTAAEPLLGLGATEGQQGSDLSDCLLYPEEIRQLFPVLKTFIRNAGLTPYQVDKKRGELKFLLLTINEKNEVMLRFVLRSQDKIASIRTHLPALLSQLPQLCVVSANIQPVHMAILEGEEEILLTQTQELRQTINGVPLFIRPQSFFQTNAQVASELYATARRWTEALDITHIWDLFCGVGGFGLHCTNKQRSLTGIEISAQAIACAKKSAELLGFEQVDFHALDLTQTIATQGKQPDLVIVNPPRRGLGVEISRYLNVCDAPYLLYSSCNAVSFARDLEELNQYKAVKVQLFDMFPHTPHYEVLTLLVKR